MALTDKQKYDIQEVIKSCLRNKFSRYSPESNNMPFHFALLGKDRMALYSFIHSLNTSFGISIFEPVAVALAKFKFQNAEAQFPLGKKISNKALETIEEIVTNLSTGGTPNKGKETQLIRDASHKGKYKDIRTVKADLYLEKKPDELYLFDLKTAKPNISSFKDFKRTLLQWRAITFVNQPDVNIDSVIAIPYNPYYPEPYQRWTLKGMLDLDKEIMVGEEFWNFLGGEGAYKDLLDCFEQAGIDLRPEIDNHFSKYRHF